AHSNGERSARSGGLLERGDEHARRPGIGLDGIAADARNVTDIEIGLESGRGAVVLDCLDVEAGRIVARRREFRRPERIRIAARIGYLFVVAGAALAGTPDLHVTDMPLDLGVFEEAVEVDEPGAERRLVLRPDQRRRVDLHAVNG